MANTRLSMRKIKDVLRLSHDVGLNTGQVALSLNISRSTVTNYQERAQRAGLSWPLPDDLTEEALEEKLFPPLVCVEAPAKALPDFDYIYRELKAHKKFNLTLDQLWREYREQHPDGYQYSQFCQLYRSYRGKLDYSMRQDHKGGEKLFVDYGEGLSLVDSQTGEPIPTQLFVASGAPRLTPSPKPHSVKSSPTGSAPTPEPSITSAAHRRLWSPIVLKAPSAEPAATSPS